MPALHYLLRRIVHPEIKIIFSPSCFTFFFFFTDEHKELYKYNPGHEYDPSLLATVVFDVNISML